MLRAHLRAAIALSTILLDIEGTTTPIAFVHDVLFSYARARVQEFLDGHGAELAVAADIALLRAEHAAETSPPPMASVAAYVRWLMDRDSKSTSLKSLQGKIWALGYQAGDLHGEVYPDVPPALERWRRHGIEVAIFSSGSVQAQRDLFASTAEGDLTRFIRAYFDTNTGPKTAVESYTRIAAALDRSASDVLFVSDIEAELNAAQAAGMQTALCVRSPERARPSGGHAVVHTFDQFPG